MIAFLLAIGREICTSYRWTRIKETEKSVDVCSPGRGGLCFGLSTGMVGFSRVSCRFTGTYPGITGSVGGGRVFLLICSGCMYYFVPVGVRDGKNPDLFLVRKSSAFLKSFKKRFKKNLTR